MGNHYGLDVPTLRELRIDVDKEWVDPNGQPRGITKLKEVAAEMAQGGIVYRGRPNILEKLAADYGIGYSFLHARNTGIDEPEWMDIQEIIGYITGGRNRMIAPPTLIIPVPDLSLVVAEDHSGGGHISGKVLDIIAPSISVIAVEDHSGGGFTSAKILDVPNPVVSGEATLIYEKFRGTDDNQITFYGIDWEAQTFTPSINHSLNRIGMKVRRHGAAGTLTVGIRATAAELPTGADLVTATFDLDTLIKEDVDYEIWIPITAQAVVNGTKYAIVARVLAGDAANYCQWRADNSSPAYTGGARCYSANSGVAWTEGATTDFIFEEGVT